jgi:hypothetical protein
MSDPLEREALRTLMLLRGAVAAPRRSDDESGAILADLVAVVESAATDLEAALTVVATARGRETPIRREN